LITDIRGKLKTLGESNDDTMAKLRQVRGRDAASDELARLIAGNCGFATATVEILGGYVDRLEHFHNEAVEADKEDED
jgi:hypothetical protein